MYTLVNLIETNTPFSIILSKNSGTDCMIHSCTIASGGKFYRFKYRRGKEKQKGCILLHNNYNTLSALSFSMAYANDNKYYLKYNGENVFFVSSVNDDEILVKNFNVYELSECYKLIDIDFQLLKINPEQFYLYSQLKKYQDCCMPTTIQMRFSLKGFKNAVEEYYNNKDYLKKVVKTMLEN